MRRVFFLWGLAVLLAHCAPLKSSTMSNAPVPTFPPFDWQGHRGCRGLLPENTLPAMRRAIDLGVTTLEMDVAISGDQQPILSHEPFFNPEISTRPDGSLLKEGDESNLLFTMPYDQIRNWDVGLKPHPRFPGQEKLAAVKPLLKDVLIQSEAYAKKGNRTIWYNIETKSMRSGDGVRHPAPAEFVRLLMNVIKEVGVEDRVVIQSFDERTLQVLHRDFPAIKTALLIEAEDLRSFDQQLSDLGFTPFIYSPAFTLVTPRLVQSCHSMGMKVIPWTVNSVVVMKQLRSMGVDGLISDYPNLYAELR